MHDREEEEDDEDEKRFVEMQRAAANLPPRSRGKARKEVFVKVPLWWMEQVAHVTRSPQTFVCVWLLHLSWEAKSLTFPVPNGRLGKRGADRRMKRRALASLEAAGLITVDRQHGKTPIVTLALL